jgi:alkylhydroperoxidase family enzyme
MLRASSEVNGVAVDLAAVNGTASDGGVAHGTRLVAFTDAVMRGDEAAVVRERAALRAVLSPEQFVDVAAVIGAFNVVDRIADATGIPLDAIMVTMSTAVRRELNLTRFASAANTPAADAV